jgi:hypothetical protein
MTVASETRSLFGIPVPLSAAEADRRLESAVHEQERAEKLVCFYLHEIYRRKHYQQFGFENVYDYALERFGFSRTKTGALLYLAKRLCQLPKLTEALATGRIGWTKAAKVASVATTETDGDWTEQAVESSYRDLERKLRDGVRPEGESVHIWMSAEQAALWVRMFELSRRLAGEELAPGQCLELIGMEFLATYEALDGPNESEQEPLTEEIDPGAEESLCPESTGELPLPTASCYAAIHARVLERDGYRCTYPGCRVRKGLHVHHLRRRSSFGRKKVAEKHAESNLTTLCWFHHRAVHKGVLGAKGRAPDGIEWRRPPLMETASERHDRLAPIDAELLADDDLFLDPLDDAGTNGSQRWDRDGKKGGAAFPPDGLDPNVGIGGRRPGRDGIAQGP